MPTNSIKTTTTPEYLPLGTFRLCLAILVFVSHSEYVYPAVGGIMNFGHLGVFLFFTASGFVIASAWFNFYENRPLAFLLNRSLRIYPMLWIVYLLTFFILYFMSEGPMHHISLDGLDAKKLFLAIIAIFTIWSHRVESGCLYLKHDRCMLS